VAQAGLARTFQNIRLFGEMSVLESVLVGGHAQHRSGLLGVLARSAAARAEERRQVDRAHALIGFVGRAPASAPRGAAALSYGEQRRVEIARALMSAPKVLVLDEPLAGMNVSEKEEVSALVLSIRAQGAAVLLIEHDMAVIRRLAQRVTVLARGRKLVEGAPEQVLSDERVQDAYLGRTS
jgi:branched-chain amino acid transport system ATP-binding protein